jgi:hypothetical protein
MTAATQIIPTQPPSHSHAFTLSPEQSALALELAKCLKLVAPASMAADAQLSWIASAVDALEGIRAAEVSAISAELRRSVTRPAQIVPEIARLVAERRGRSARTATARKVAELPPRPFAPPLSRQELDTLPDSIIALGLKGGFIERREGKFYERTPIGGTA